MINTVKTVTINVTSNQVNLNIFTLAGSPTVKIKVIVNIAANVDIYSTSTSLPALKTGSGWKTGSLVKIVNNGNIYGMGGAGGTGGSNSIVSAGFGGERR